MNTTDYFWASVNHSIRKYYIHISWTEGGKGKNCLGYKALSYDFLLHFGGEEARTATVLQHHHNNLHCHNITARRREVCVCVCFLEGFLRVQREWGQVQRREEDVVCREPVVWWLSVERDELCLCAARRSLRNLLLLLGRLLLLGATRRGHLAREKVKQDIKAGEKKQSGRLETC